MTYLASILALALSGSWLSPLSVDEVAAMRKLYDDFRQQGQTAKAREQLEAFWREHDASNRVNAAYLLEKSTILGWLDDHEGSQRAFNLVPDEALEEPHHLFNRLQDRIEEDLELAEPLILKLAQAKTSVLADWIHDSYAQSFMPEVRDGVDIEAHLELMERLVDSELVSLRKVSRGLHAWLDALYSGDPSDAAIDKEELTSKEAVWTRDVRYRLALARHALEQSSPPDWVAPSLLDIIHELEARRQSPPEDLDKISASILRARDHYHLSMACYTYARHFCVDDPEDLGAWLLRAARWDTDAQDQHRRHAFFYERVTLGGKTDYRSVCAKELEALGRKDDAIAVWMEVARVKPDLLADVRKTLARLVPDRSFEDLWAEQLEATLPKATGFTLDSLQGEPMRLADYRGRWVLIDFWGTWCSPCRKELPDLEKLHREIERDAKDRAAILTIACNDTEEAVKNFMTEREYTFAVAMGNDEVVQSFDVRGYPTKVLVTPNGHWMKLAYGAGDWTATARRYMLEMGGAPNK